MGTVNKYLLLNTETVLHTNVEHCSTTPVDMS